MDSQSSDQTKHPETEHPEIPRPPGAEEKAWGWAEQLSEQRDPTTGKVLCRTVRVFIKRGGYSSIHRHKESHNFFAVTSGLLELRRMRQNEATKILCAWGQGPSDTPAMFQAGAYHQFQALTNVLGLEIYVAIPDGDAGPQDIERLTNNGLHLGELMGAPCVITDAVKSPADGEIVFGKFDQQTAQRAAQAFHKARAEFQAKNP